MHPLPPLGSHRQRAQAFARGQLELVLGEYAMSVHNGTTVLRPLHRNRTVGPRLRRPAALLARWSQRALRLSANANQYKPARRPPRPSQSVLPPVHSQLPLQPYPAYLVIVGTDRYQRTCRLQPAAARQWQQLSRAAAAQGIELELVSGFRSVTYQSGIWQRKLARGQSLVEISRVSAPPARSEHHSGRALDLASGEGPVLEQSFAQTPAYRWLKRNASRYGFVESYPRDNPYGIVAEPWHWCWRGSEPLY